ncbi:MAG TPA: DUF5335 family protein [Polyangia bacterium]
MTRTVDILPERWTSFLQTINRVAGGRPVRLEVARRELGDQELADFLPLLEIDFPTKGSERGELVISVGSDRGELTHVIARPTAMAVGLNDANEPEWLAIDEHGDATTIIHFERLPALGQEYGATR